MEVECLSYSMESEKQPRTLVMTDWIKGSEVMCCIQCIRILTFDQVSLTIRNSAGFPTFA